MGRRKRGWAMARILAVSGVGLDMAWPTLGPTLGRDRRALAQRLLVTVVGAARSAAVDVLMLVGALVDRRTVMPRTLTLAAQALASFPGDVLITPGPGDWYSPDGPYETVDWPRNTMVWKGSAFTPAHVANLVIWGSAWTVAGDQRVEWPGLEERSGAALLVRPGLAFPSDEPASDLGVHVVTSGPSTLLHPTRTVLGPLLPPVGSPSGGAVVIELHPSGEVAQRVLQVGEGLGGDVDLTPHRSQAEVDTAISTAVARAEPWSIVRLVGLLAEGILLPGTSGLEPSRIDVVVDHSPLDFEITEPRASEHGSRAEFLRGLGRADEPDDERHQAIALGLRALEVQR